MANFRWSGKREQAACLVAQDELSNEDIAARVGITRQTLDNWKKHPDFRARVAEHVAAWRDLVRARGIADREKRIEQQNDRWQRMRRVIDERAVDQAMADVPGGETGLLVHRIRVIGTGQNAQVVDEYEVDVALLKELREHEKHTAQEMGQWVDKGEVTGKLDMDLKVEDVRGKLTARLATLAIRRRESGADSQPEPEGSGEASV